VVVATALTGSTAQGAGAGAGVAKVLAFRVEGGGLYLAEADGSHAREVTTADVSAPSWSADGTRLAFSVPLGNERSRLDVVTRNGAEEHRLLDRQPAGLGDVAWAPNRHFLVAHVRGATDFEGDIAIVKLADGQARRVTRGPGDDKTPQVSPDGRWIAFKREEPNGGSGIWVVGWAGRGLHRIVPDRMRAAHPWWSPDGSSIVFNDASGSVVPGAGKSHIFVVRRDGTHLRQLTFGSKLTDFHPSWAADGSIYFTRYAFAPISMPFALYRMSADGTNVVRLKRSGISGDANDATLAPS
jgi:Tol biopolymer transport system component